LYDLLSGGAPPDLDPDAIVEVAEVRIFEGPMLIATLAEAGIEASGVESFDIATKARSRMRIFVRRADQEKARRVLG
jgi:hypothetical protein